VQDFGALTSKPLSDIEIEVERRRLDELRAFVGKGPAPAAVKEKLRSLMWDKAGVEKDAQGLGQALEDIGKIRSRLLPEMRVSNATLTVNYEWLDAIDVTNMVDVCELIVHSSLERKESRGPFFRKDFPDTDNVNWLTANVLRKSGNSFTFEQRPYELPFFQPGFERRPNLEVAW
jgi:succinate dehydrogenase / fumarate reductase, flavoprotein subunit